MDSDVKKISIAVIKRLPRYHRYLGELLQRDVERISSQELSRIMGLTASQIRQDLSNFEEFGQQGYGYRVRDLFEQINKILGLNCTYNCVIIGAGNLGQALANNEDFKKRGFVLKGMFDINPKIVGLKIAGVDVMDIDNLKEFIFTESIDIGVICTPKEAAPDIAKMLCSCKIKGIWNFAPVDLKAPEGVVVENVHLTDSLFTLSYRIQEQKLRERFKKGTAIKNKR
ncbi:Redox-sensing transcriptional repressor Rex [Koleobacter methoxysyntrophicus]|uniref:Redox-sensing transcriptional repressor Rex n=1 Tax=Koleobacter methoxysyntrophicus TaxID=2751313 RepID=A0A8A0RJX8_9FIRM|nr:redox-sensing transcriptional repressor Rex [Koleobacter methoxysyntrophicus]QSQ07817.1 Redox-sensing transcriptional repressor Rex [Koleobacter methoxysyntrophicus]